MPKGYLPLVYRACPTIAILLDKPPVDGVVDTMPKACDHLAKRVSTRRGGLPVPHPSPMEPA